MKTKILELIDEKIEERNHIVQNMEDEIETRVLQKLRQEIEEMEELLYPPEIEWKTTPPDIQKVINENFSKMI